MGRKGGKKKGNDPTAAPQRRVSTTLREESSGKKQSHVNAKSMCKLDHLKSLALWAATEASIPSLGAFFGERLAATTDSLGVRGDSGLFVCERCESILEPGNNCTVRIEKNKSKAHGRKKPIKTAQNSVAYRCHFCSHRNLMRGTPKGYMKEIYPPKCKASSKLQHSNSAGEKFASSEKPITGTHTVNKSDAVALHIVDLERSPSPPPATVVSLLDSKRRKRNRLGAKKLTETETVEKTIPVSSKRKRKSWTSLKEIAQSSEHDIGKKSTNLTIPFLI